MRAGQQSIRERAVEAAFLDICIHGCMDGVELGKKLKELNPNGIKLRLIMREVGIFFRY